MRVLIVHPGIFVYGGAEKVIVRLSNFLTSRGVENALLTTAILPEMEKDLRGARVIIQPQSQGLRNFLNIREILALAAGTRRLSGDFDVVNFHNYPAELGSLLCGTPSVWMCNEPPEISLGPELESSKLRHRAAARFILALDRFAARRRLTAAVVADDFNSRRFQRIYGVVPEVINYGIDHDFFSLNPGGLRRDPSHFTVLQAGMITPQKNQMESLKAVERLSGEIPGIRLILAGYGEGEYFESVKRYLSERGLGSRVLLTGHVDKDKIRELYHTSDVLLHPVKSQGGWLSPFEALSSGLPVIVSGEMTASDIIKKNGIGTVTSDYTSAVLETRNNRGKCLQAAEKGRKWVADNLSWDNYCGRMLSLFKTVAAGK